jgi:hypothetical protein
MGAKRQLEATRVETFQDLFELSQLVLKRKPKPGKYAVLQRQGKRNTSYRGVVHSRQHYCHELLAPNRHLLQLLGTRPASCDFSKLAPKG